MKEFFLKLLKGLVSVQDNKQPIGSEVVYYSGPSPADIVLDFLQFGSDSMRLQTLNQAVAGVGIQAELVLDWKLGPHWKSKDGHNECIRGKEFKEKLEGCYRGHFETEVAAVRAVIESYRPIRPR